MSECQKDLVRAVLNSRKPQRNLLEKKKLEISVKLKMKSGNFLRNFWRTTPEKFLGIKYP